MQALFIRFKKLDSSDEFYQMIRLIRGATAIGINIAGIRLAVLTLVQPSILVPISTIIREPVTDIYVIAASGSSSISPRPKSEIAP